MDALSCNVTAVTPDLVYLFKPRSVAVVGTSRHPGKIGYKILDNIVASRYAGRIYPVNPEGGEILGQTVYRTIEELPEGIDLATIVIPAKLVFDAVQRCGQRKVKFLSIISSGFSEVGNLQEEKALVTYAREHGMRILGPNIFGLYSAGAPINATFGPRDVPAGSVAIISQSGALGVAMIGKTAVENIGLSAIISVGNKSDLDEADLLEYLINDPATQVILMYIEGIKHGDKLVTVLNRARAVKPVVVIKSGRSKRGARAAASHTGSLAGDDEIFSDIMKQCGVIRAETILEALNWCKFLSQSPLPKGENTVIITNGGGLGVMAADACEKYGVNLYDDVENMKQIFAGEVPEFGSVKNPIDLTGQAQSEDYERALNAALKNDFIHSVICLGCEAAMLDADTLFPKIVASIGASQTSKPVVLSFFGGKQMEEQIARYRTTTLPLFANFYDAISCLGAKYVTYRNMNYGTDKAAAPETLDLDFSVLDRVINSVRQDKRQFLFSYEGLEILKSLGIPVPASYLARNIAEAVKYAEEIHYPVAMKIVSRDILHKSDVGGVALHLDNKNEVMDAYQAIMYNCRRHLPYARLEGIEVSEMVAPGTETIIGARRDDSFGPIIMFGLGGIYVEVLKDVAFRAFPLNRKEAGQMVGQIKSYPLLLGVRGAKRKDINGIIEVLLKVGALLCRTPEISDIEINPLVAYDEGVGVKALDARIILTKSEEEK